MTVYRVLRLCIRLHRVNKNSHRGSNFCCDVTIRFNMADSATDYFSFIVFRFVFFKLSGRKGKCNGRILDYGSVIRYVKSLKEIGYRKDGEKSF